MNTEVKDVPVLEKKLYTVCFWSLTPKAFPFLDEEVAKSLARIVKSAWPAEALVDGDLEQRDRAKTGKLWRLSRAMPKDEQLRIMMKGMKVMKAPVAKAPEKETTATKRRATAGASANVKQAKKRRHN
ncbi:hypothetical protein P3T76_007568 [Phytophthora citrophthora]|uniref:Uncharacterized protein n=1 Tax=Phytophthora citrophthora TaxID=4793 RepID=A0AAD9GLQ9_9STRA|nr:hypothetical protein P3T76_007568 [Phytophthora citrophthora]